ncbi:MAG: sulfur carrier protein ThiS [Mixta calida]|jgi:sulfur carrier protein|uniref:Sulfur carrier protein ThiS n=1 Tax=Mixta calida TaxID=665913 RepID=A0ABM6S647_9GAMM|nr:MULTISPECIES: sulfur carrier protein ThiS [Mixta]AIX75719.1 thiamine biosynthesis protein ThiS [Pantoea sp. PSNIH2]MDU3818724.1 sulfur carrier protein ThiS [Pantoea sp.]POU41315.1 sulfur carrier protein ThiS [Pantoea sp. PSNIH5]POU59024.1 sulfur carrier protein ThiS [Pantoea sp. PSNIH4]POY65807.1 sulfur carrier protein ThiS [Pantoea sp. PSNIH3]HCW47564.1 sulfur carrier protein ThiS [Erwiniaceae bacterium]
MRIVVNDETLMLETPLTLDRLLEKLGCHQPGTALAVNQQIVPRASWPDYALRDDDEVVIFQAIAGG